MPSHVALLLALLGFQSLSAGAIMGGGGLFWGLTQETLLGTLC